MDLHISYNVTRTYRASVPCAEADAAEVLAAMVERFREWMKYREDRPGVFTPRPTFDIDPIQTGRYVDRLKLHGPIVDEPAWHDPTVQFGIGDLLAGFNLEHLREDHAGLVDQLTEALRNQGYLAYPDCPAEPDACGERWPHEWKNGSHHVCAQVPGHKFKHVCSCEADDF